MWSHTSALWVAEQRLGGNTIRDKSSPHRPHYKWECVRFAPLVGYCSLRAHSILCVCMLTCATANPCMWHVTTYNIKGEWRAALHQHNTQTRLWLMENSSPPHSHHRTRPLLCLSRFQGGWLISDYISGPVPDVPDVCTLLHVCIFTAANKGMRIFECLGAGFATKWREFVKKNPKTLFRYYTWATWLRG